MTVKRFKTQLEKFRTKGKPARFTLGTLVLMGCCVMLLIVATFTQINFIHPIIPLDLIPHWSKYFTPNGIWEHGFLKHYKYIPQIPAVFFILSLLDRKYGIMTILGYIVLGLIGYPIFALGGGWRYIFEYGFYYIVGYIPAMFFAGSILKENHSFFNILKSVFVGVLVVHIVGCLGMVFIATLKHESSTMIVGWIMTMSGMKMLYDMFFSFIAIILGQVTKRVLWTVMS